MPTTTESDNRRDDSPSSIEAIKRAVGISPSRRNRQPRNSSVDRQNRFRLKEDYRGRLPLWLSRFIGYRRPADKAPHDPIGPLSFLRSIPLKYEVWFFGWIGSFVGILLIEAIMTTNTAFRDLYHAPIIVASFGATAVLVFGAIDSPLAQPRNVFGGQVISAIVGVAITRLFAMDPAYINHLGNTEFHPAPFINGAICMATALLAMSITGTLHPPAGATALIAAIEMNATRLSWRYIPVVMSSACIMLGWALLINNLGRRKYPQYWWVSQRCFVVENAPGPTEDEEMAIATSTENPARQAEDGGRTKEALQQERMQGIGGNRRDMEDAVARAGRAGRPM